MTKYYKNNKLILAWPLPEFCTSNGHTLTEDKIEWYENDSFYWWRCIECMRVENQYSEGDALEPGEMVLHH